MSEVSSMANLTPHPLVAGIATGLVERQVPLDAKGEELIGAGEAKAAGVPDTIKRGMLQAVRQDASKSIVGLAASADVPELVMFAGFVGATLKQQGEDWCVFYLDALLQNWLLVPTHGIVFRDPVEDDQAPCGIHDVLWVRADTPVVRASRSLSVEAQFLSGQHTRAGDVEAAPSGGTLAASTGVFCEARSPGCCRCTVYTR
jgi:hypothetical protein